MADHRDPAGRRARVIRSTVILVIAALAVYVVFILTMAERSGGMR